MLTGVHGKKEGGDPFDPNQGDADFIESDTQLVADIKYVYVCVQAVNALFGMKNPKDYDIILAWCYSSKYV